MANRTCSRGATRLAMTLERCAALSNWFALICIDLDDSLVIAKSLPTSADFSVATPNEQWARGRFVGDAKAFTNFERSCCGDVEREMGARTKSGRCPRMPDGNEKEMIGVAWPM